MKKTIFFLSIMIFGNLLLAKSQTSDDYSILYNRIYSKNFNARSSYPLSNQKEDGSFINTTTFAEHLDEMLKIARTYKTPGENYHSEELLNAYKKAWNWWVKTNPTHSNWWMRSIGWPKSLYPSFVVIGKELKALAPTEYASLLKYLMAEWTPANINKYSADPSSANTTDVTNYIMAAAIVDEDVTTINQVAGFITDAVRIVTGARSHGIHPDYGFSEHSGSGRQLYFANYGKEFTGGILNFMELTAGTYFQLSEEKTTIFENLYLHSVSWMSYRNTIDVHQYGRFPTANYYNVVINQLTRLVALNTPQRAQLSALHTWMTRPSTSNATNIQIGNKMFWRFDYMTHKGLNYFVTTKTTSTRTVGCESGNGGGLNNYYTGAGVNYLYVEGNEQREIVNDQNWRRLPGITSPQRPTTSPLPLVEWGRNSSNLNDFAGGVSDEVTGASGFIFERRHTEIDLMAYKSYFYFKDFYVALGAGIRSGLTHNVPFPYATTVNQVRFNGQLLVDNNGSMTMITNAINLNPSTSNWAFINGTGYQFINNTNLNFEVKRHGATDIAWIGINHGMYPAGQQYAYAVYPNLKPSEFLAKVNAQPFEVIANNIDQQAVVDIPNKTVQIVFFKAGKLNLDADLGSCEVDKPSIVQLRWDGDSLFVSAANPYCESRPIESLTVKLSGAYSDSTNTAVVDSDTTTLTISMPLNEFQGKSTTVGLKRLPTSVLSTDFKETLKIYPNQVKTGENVTVILPDNAESLLIYKMEGVLVQRLNSKYNNERKLSVNTEGFAPGIYILKTNGIVGKLVVE
jgi:chondroitin AC lyase